MHRVLGMEVKKAVKLLEEEGYRCIVREYSSKRPVEADTTRVIRQKLLDEKTAELVVCGFKTSV